MPRSTDQRNSNLRVLGQALTVGMLTLLAGMGAALGGGGCTGNPVSDSAPVSSTRTELAMNHALAGLPPGAERFVYSGFDEYGEHIYGPVALPRADRNVLTGVPSGVALVTVEYRTQDSRLLAWGSTGVQPSATLVEATPTPATGTTVLQVENTTGARTRMIFVAYNRPTDTAKLEVFDLTADGPVATTLLPNESKWRYVDMGPHDKYEIYSTELNADKKVDNVLDSFVVAFGDPQDLTTIPYCPKVFGLYPNGVNYFEATLNVPTPETIDISMNQGANSYIAVQCSPTPDAQPTPVPGWSTNYGHDPVSSFRNSFLNVDGKYDDNCCLPGVFAFGLTNCNAAPSACKDDQGNELGPFCSNSVPHCQVQRKNGEQGGIVLVQFQGLMDVRQTPAPACR